MKKLILWILIYFIPSMGICIPYTEHWTLNNNFWIYYDGTGNGANMLHRSTGGQANSGYVYTNLADSSLWDNSQYVPAQLLDPQTTPSDAGGSIINGWANIYVNNLNSADLKGGLLRFFVADWEQVNQAWVMYLLKAPITVGQNTWTKSTFFISSNPKDWIKVNGGLQKDLSDILVAPQQYGFAFNHITDKPTGELGFDTFTLNAVPEPSAILLTLLGIGWFYRFNKRKK